MTRSGNTSPTPQRAEVAARLDRILGEGMKRASHRVAEVCLLRRVPANGHDAGRSRLPRTRVATAGVDSRAHVRGEPITSTWRRSSRCACGANRRDPGRAAREHHQSRPQGAIRVRHAGAVVGRGEARRVFRQPGARREPCARTMGGRRPALPQSPVAPRVTPSGTSSGAWSC